jgi:hypothetical protein
MVEAAHTPLVVLLVVVLVTGNRPVGMFAALGVGTLVRGGLGFFAARSLCRSGTNVGRRIGLEGKAYLRPCHAKLAR